MLELLLDATRKRAVSSLKTDGDKQFADPAFGEVLALQVARLAPLSETVNQRQWAPQDWTGWTLKAAIGRGFEVPLAGTWTITFTAQDLTIQTTAAIVYNATAAQVSTALNALGKITAAGGVTVTSNGAGYYLITFGNVGIQTVFTGSGANLAPLSLVEPGILIAGTVSAQCIQSIRLLQNPAAYCDLNTDSAAASITVDILQVGGAGANEKVRVSLSPTPYDGAWTLIVGANETDFISFNAGVDEVVAAVEALASVGTDNVSVLKEADYTWLLMFVGAKAETDMGVVDGDATGIRVIPYRTGNLDLRTAAISLLFQGSETAEAVFEIEGTPALGYPQKLFRQAVTLDDAINDPTGLPAPLVPGFVGLNFRIKADGTFQLYDSDTLKYTTIAGAGADGSVGIDVGQVTEA